MKSHVQKNRKMGRQVDITRFSYLYLLVLPSCDCTWIVHVDQVELKIRAKIRAKIQSMVAVADMLVD